MGWTHEHPEADVPDHVINALHTAGFGDSSWHNDTCPVWTVQLGGDSLEAMLQVWVDYKEEERREMPGERYSVYVNIGCSEQGIQVLHTDDDKVLLAWLAGEVEERGAIEWVYEADADRPKPVMQLAELRSIPPALLVAMAAISRADVSTEGELYKTMMWLDGNPNAPCELISLVWAMAGGGKGW